MKTIITIIITGTLVLTAAIGFAFSGIYDVSASSPHSGITSWLLSATSRASVERRASSITVPDLSDDALALTGVSDFNEMCEGCHGAPGVRPGAIGQGLNPPAPDLTESGAHMSPAELFWVTKHGIKMTGMPAWGSTHDDEAIWPVVAFMIRLPEIDAAAYADYVVSTKGMGHHSPGANHANEDNHDVAHTDNDVRTNVHDEGVPNEGTATDEHDHSTHSH